MTNRRASWQVARAAGLLACALPTLAGGMQAQGQTTRPRPLSALEQARSAISAGRIDWVTVQRGDENRSVRHVTRVAANGDTIYEFRGDKDGWCVFFDGDEMKVPALKYPQLYLQNADGFWYMQETGLSAQLWRADGRFPPWAEKMKDVRFAGMTVTARSLRVPEGAGCLSDPPIEVASWEENRQGALRVVVAHATSGDTITWVINPDKGWNAERITQRAPSGEVLAEAVCVLRQYDGLWLPERTDYFSRGELIQSVRIVSARLNQPDAPRRFTGNDLGFEPGTCIGIDNDPALEGLEHAAPVQRWDGETVMTVAEFDRLVRLGERHWGPKFERLNRGEPFTSPYETPVEQATREMDTKRERTERALGKYKGLWEDYVRDFIKRYELHSAQTAQAQQILTQCQENAEEQTRRQRTELLPLWTERQSAGRDFDARKQQRLDKLAAEVERRVGGIFEKELKPRLEKLPTRAQRKAADKRAKNTTAPAPAKH